MTNNFVAPIINNNQFAEQAKLTTDFWNGHCEYKTNSDGIWIPEHKSIRIHILQQSQAVNVYPEQLENLSADICVRTPSPFCDDTRTRCGAARQVSNVGSTVRFRFGRLALVLINKCKWRASRYSDEISAD